MPKPQEVFLAAINRVVDRIVSIKRTDLVKILEQRMNGDVATYVQEVGLFDAGEHEAELVRRGKK